MVTTRSQASALANEAASQRIEPRRHLTSATGTYKLPRITEVRRWKEGRHRRSFGGVHAVAQMSLCPNEPAACSCCIMERMLTWAGSWSWPGLPVHPMNQLSPICSHAQALCFCMQAMKRTKAYTRCMASHNRFIACEINYYVGDNDPLQLIVDDTMQV